MREEIREELGKVAHQAMVRYFDGKKSILTKTDWTWEGLDEEIRELYRFEAESVVSALAMLVLPVFKNILAEDDVKQLLEQMRKDA